MKLLKNLKSNVVIGLCLGTVITLVGCGETESTPVVDYTDKTLITSEKLLDKSGVYIMDATAKINFKDSLGDGKLPSQHEGQVMTISFSEDGELNVKNDFGDGSSVECIRDYSLVETGIEFTGPWIMEGGNESCPSDGISEFEMELTENYLLIQGAEMVESGYVSSTGYVMVFRRSEAVE